MGLLRKTHRRHGASRPRRRDSRGAASSWRSCRFEQMESRHLLSISVAPIQIGIVYLEDSSTSDQIGDQFELTWNGGADNSQLTELTIETDKLGDGLGMGDAFFDTAAGGEGVYGYSPFAVVHDDGIDSVAAAVSDGGTTLTLTFEGFDAGERLVFSIDVDEQGLLSANAVAEGGEFEGSILDAAFAAPYYYDAAGTDIFYDAFDDKLSASGLPLPDDDYDPPGEYSPVEAAEGVVYTAGAFVEIVQEPLPITLAGTVFEDLNVDNKQQSGEPGIEGATLTLLEWDGEGYVDAGLTSATDADGNYFFEGLSPGTYRVVETQPSGYLSVGSTAGTVNGSTRGVVVNEDILGDIALLGGEDSVDNDFAETLPAEISGHVYHDADNDGRMDPGEDGIADVQVVLYVESEGLLIATGAATATDDNGYYEFTDLAPGKYKLVEIQPSDYLDGLDAAGSAGGSAHNPGDLIDAISLLGGQSGENYDFGELLSACVSGYVYVDADNDGRFDPEEAGIAGATLVLLDADGQQTGRTTETDAAGYYVFCGLVPGVYRVAEVQPEGYYDGLDTPGSAGGTAENPGDLIRSIPLQSGAKAADYNFGELLPAEIGGMVFADNDGDGQFSAGDTPLSGVKIHLLNQSGTRIDWTTTDAAGKYAFANLAPGAYGVEEIQPADYLDSGERVGTAGGSIVANDKIRGAALASGTTGLNYDFWEVAPAKIAGYVFQDGAAIVLEEGDPLPHVPSLRDGEFTPDDAPLAGVVLYLCDAGGVPLLDGHGNPISTTTNAEGYYEFNRLYPGVYSVVEVQPDGYIAGIDTAGSHGGTVVNGYSSVDPGLLATLAVDPDGSAIVLISLDPGDAAVEYNFSEVLIEYEPPYVPPHIPPARPTPITPAPTILPQVDYRPVGAPYHLFPEVVEQPIFGGGGGPGGYTWHLSVIDAGHPRSELAGTQFVQASHNPYFDPVSWTGADLDRSQWVLTDQTAAEIEKFHFGMAGAVPVVGDWNGSGTSKIGAFLDGVWFLDLNGNGVWDEGDLWIKLGDKNDQPVAGDWNGDGKTDVGIFGPTWIGDLKAIYVEPGLPDSQNPPKDRPKNVPPDPTEAAIGWRTMKPGNGGRMRSDLIDHVFQFGSKGDRAVAGDWNGDGIHAIGVFRNGAWFLDRDGDGRWGADDELVEFGQEGDLPVVGDWTGDGLSKLGVFRSGQFILDANNNRQIDAADKVFELGGPGDRPVAGDWNGDGVDEVGVYQDNAVPDPQA
ncbi:MAG: hypothetical protein JW959_14480 [Pirellulales bacterium]|nr:hypothetical protein [Pirellulales bacterium]